MYVYIYICIGLSAYPQKHQPSLFFAKPLINQKILKAPLLLFPIPFSQFAPLYFVFFAKLSKIKLFSEPHNIKIFSSFISSFKSLKVTKLLVIISQFKFLFVTEKNIFVYELFLSLNISDFSLFFM